MSSTVTVSSKQHLDSLISSSKILIIDFWAEWCAPCKAMSPAYEELSKHLSKPPTITFAKVNIDEQQEIARTYSVASIPTFKIFKNGQEVENIVGTDRAKLSSAVKKIAAEAGGDGGSNGFGETSGSSTWLGSSLTKGYKDVSDQVDLRGLDLLNADTEFGTVKDLFAKEQPASLKGKSSGKEDWIESDTDEQLMLYIPFQSTLKVQSLLITSVPSKENEESEIMRPKTIRIYKNRAHTLGFDEADDIEATQVVELQTGDWDEKTGTAKLELRFVKFQNITSLVLFVVDGDGDGERTRIDRIRVIGESGEKRDMGKLEKVGDGAD